MKYKPDYCLKLSSLFWLQVLMQMLLMSHHCHCQQVITNPLPVTQPPFMVYVFATLNEEASVTCTNLIAAGTPPVWQLKETMEYLTFVNNTAVNHSYIQVSNPTNTPSTVKLTITNFTSDLNVFRVVCRPDKTSNDSVSATILIGIQDPPMLSQVPVYNVFENEMAEISVVTNNAFPPYDAMWTCDGNNLMYNMINTGCPKCGNVNISMGSITLDSVPISCRETTFQVIIPEAKPQPIAFFSLNVRYAPSAQLTGITQIFASVSDNVTLRVTNGSIDGNPNPTVSWRFNAPDGPFITASGRYSMESDGLLTISSITEDDFGEYYFTASNNVGENITAIISLLEIEPRIKSVGYVSQNGEITLNFSLAHTGYESDYNQVSVNASCSKDTGEPDHDTAPHPANLSYACAEQCINSNLIGTGSIVGPVAAGIVYQCSVTVSTSNGSNTFTIDSITPTTGRPSKPIIKWITNDESDTVTIYLRSVHAGIDSTDERSSLTFRVVIQSGSGRVIVHNETQAQYESNSTIYFSQRISENGDYVIHVTAINQYGFSDTVMESITISRPPPTSPPRTSPSPSPYESATPAGSSGSAAVSIVPGMVIAVVVLVIAALI